MFQRSNFHEKGRTTARPQKMALRGPMLPSTRCKPRVASCGEAGMIQRDEIILRRPQKHDFKPTVRTLREDCGKFHPQPDVQRASWWRRAGTSISRHLLPDLHPICPFQKPFIMAHHRQPSSGNPYRGFSALYCTSCGKGLREAGILGGGDCLLGTPPRAASYSQPNNRARKSVLRGSTEHMNGLGCQV